MPGIIGSTGCDRSSACTCDFSSTHSTRACSGGSRYSPTTSRTLSTNCGSKLSLKVSVRWGLSRNAFQIRPTVERDSPERLAIDARDQCVASVGVSSKVATTTASTCSSVIVRGAPGRGLSTRPPVRALVRRPPQGPPAHALDLLVGDGAGCARPRLVAQRPQAAPQKPGPPL